MAKRYKRRKKQTFNFSIFQGQFVRYFVAILLIGFIVFISTKKGIQAFRNLSYFKVSSIRSSTGEIFKEEKRFSYLKGKNIFSVDLQEFERQLRWAYPQAKSVRVLRQLPNVITVEISERVPFAIISIARLNVTVDEKGFVVSKTAVNKNLPLILGVSYRSDKVLVGRVIESKSAQLAISILKAFKSESLSSRIKIEKVNIGNLSKIYCYIKDGPEVIIDQDRVTEKTKTLKMVLNKMSVKIEDLRYIDLRFKEPVIRKK